MVGGAKPYRIGSADERWLADEAMKLGYRVGRAAGSHGTDLLVATPDGVYAVDVKRNTWAPPRSRMMMAGWLDLSVWPVLAMVTVPGNRRVVSWREVAADGSMGEPLDQAPWSL